MRLAKNHAEFIAALFQPIDGRTFDGYIVRINNDSIDLFVLGKNYTINRNGVLCEKAIMPNGKTWYNYVNGQTAKLFGSYAERVEWCETMLDAAIEPLRKITPGAVFD